MLPTVPSTAVLAVIQLTFAPVVTVGDLAVRLETVALALVILAALVVAVRIARRTPVDIGRSPDDSGPSSDDPNHLRADDLLYIVVAALPGAVAGGRAGYALLHLDYYNANPGALLDIGQGGFQLSLGIVGGTVTAAIVAGLLGASIGRWMHATILPLLLAIAGGKLVMVLGGDGQGLPWDGSWATAYAGAGPWGSLAPATPSHPAQVYEAIATVGVLLVLSWLLGLGAFSRRSGSAFLVGIGLWALARAGVATFWRDPAVAGDLRMDQVVSIAIAAGALVLLVVGAILGRLRRARGTGVATDPDADAGHPAGARPGGGSGPEWPDPASRPRI